MKRVLFLLMSGVLLWCSVAVSVAAPITGDPTGIVTLVEYYDYACPHCRRMEAVIDRLQAAYPRLQVVHRVTPLLTPMSYTVARFALAASEQGQWRSVHQALMRLPTAPTWTDLRRIAKQFHLNTRVLVNVMQQTQIRQQILRNVNDAEKNVTGSRLALPLFVFKLTHGHGQVITLTGEQPYALLAAVVAQLGDEAHVQMVQTTQQRRH